MAGILAVAEKGEPDQRKARKFHSDELLKAMANLEFETEAARARLASVHVAEEAYSQSLAAELGLLVVLENEEDHLPRFVVGGDCE